MMTNNNNNSIYDFYKIYAEKVAPKFKRFEKIRKEKLGIFSFIVICAIALAAIFIYKTEPENTVIILIITAVLIGVIGAYFAKNFRNMLKKECMHILLEAFGDIKWFPNSKLVRDSDMHDSELFSEYNVREDDDVFSGTYKGTKFIVSESYMHYETKGRRKMVWPVFDGVIIMIDSNKIIKNKTIVTTKGDKNIRNRNPLVIFLLLTSIPYSIFRIFFYYGGYHFSPDVLVDIGIALIVVLAVFFIRKSNKPKEVLNTIKLEDTVFCKKYNVFSSDEIESRYLLTTSFMERFKNLHTAFGSNKAKCAFFRDKIMFSISTSKNIFEIGSLFAPINNLKQINVFLSEISAIYNLIDYFKLTEKTGL